MSDEVAQEIFEYARRGKLDALHNVIHLAHPDSFVAYDGSTALLVACRNGHLEVCKLLLAHGADAGVRSDDGSSALLLACCAGNHELVSLLLNDSRCCVNDSNEDGFTALDMALHYNHIHITDLLKCRGGVCSGVTTPETGEIEAGPSEKWGYGVFDQ